MELIGLAIPDSGIGSSAPVAVGCAGEVGFAVGTGANGGVGGDGDQKGGDDDRLQAA